MPPPDCRLGVDVGGTNTDAVIMDAADRVLAKAKVPGTADITSGIVAAIDAVLGTPGVEPQRISHVMLGTTHATNAILADSVLVSRHFHPLVYVVIRRGFMLLEIKAKVMDHGWLARQNLDGSDPGIL